MKLQFGFDDRGIAVSIDEVPRGRTELCCPYCWGKLTAKKGRIKQHHFAHTETTCRQVKERRELPSLPCYDNFFLHLSGKELELLQLLWQQGEAVGYHSSKEFARLGKKGFLQCVDWKFKQYRFAEKGKIPVGGLPLAGFVEYQEPRWLWKLARLQGAANRARREEERNDCIADLKLYRAQYRRVLQQQLYFLQVDVSDGRLYKIGVTTRAIAEWGVGRLEF